MNKLKRQIKNQANSMLPGDELKNSIRSKVVGENNVQTIKKPVHSKSFYVKSIATVASVLVVVLALIIGIGVFAKDTPQVAQGYDTVVLIDINPSFEIVADNNDIVKSVTGLNSDARIVLLGKNYSGKNLYEVCSDIVNTAIALNYVDTVTNMINISAYNPNRSIEQSALQKIQNSVSNTQGQYEFVIVDSEQAKTNLINDIIAQYGQLNGLSEKTITELHRILMNYDITKEEELDKLEDLWEEELENAGFDDDIAEDILDKWKEENLKPLGDNLDEEVEEYIELFELRLIYNGKDKDEVNSLVKQENNRLKAYSRKELRTFIDSWWIDLQIEFVESLRYYLQGKGFSQERIDNIIDKYNSKDNEAKNEIAYEYFEEYYESQIEGEDFEFDLEDIIEEDD